MNETSFNALVRNLKPGECVSKVRQVDASMPIGKTAEELPEIKRQLRSACQPAVARAKEKTGLDYSVEVGELVMPGGSFYAVAVITCNQPS